MPYMAVTNANSRFWMKMPMFICNCQCFVFHFVVTLVCIDMLHWNATFKCNVTLNWMYYIATCPSVEPKDRSVCTNECSSDDDCQYDRICCTNECGGHTCSDFVEMCQVRWCSYILV